MRFLTWANDPSDPRCELLFASANHFGIEVEPIGVGKEYRGGVSKIEWLAEEIESWSPYAYDVICMDAFDSLFVRNPCDIVTDRATIVYAGERWFRNRPPLMQWHFDVSENRLYRYPNAGLVSGPSTFLENLYSDMRIASQGSLETREQWFVSLAFVNYQRSISIDHDCRLFYCCGGEWRRFAGEVVDGRFRNKRTGTYPYILHAPIPRRSLPIRERVAKELGII
jgi:hypothetical protein